MWIKNRYKTALLLIAMSLLLVSGLSGQILYQQPAAAEVGFYYSAWTMENTDEANGSRDEIRQMAFPLSVFLPLQDNFEARLFVADAVNNVEMSGLSNDLSGMSDVRVQLAHSFSEDRLLLSLGLNLPTGKKKLNPDSKRGVIEVLSRDYLILPFRRYGEGFGLNLLFGGATQIGKFMCGASATYQFNGGYEPYEGEGDYSPGNMFSLSANTNVIFDRIIYTADFIYSTFTSDRLDGRDIYKLAPQFDGRLTATFNDEPYSTQVGLRFLLRGRNTRYDFASGAIESQLKKYGNEVSAYARVVYTTGAQWQIAPFIESRKISASEEYLTESSVFSFGLNIGKEFDKNFIFDGGVRYFTGSTDDGAVELRGLQFSGSLTAGF
jgi:hypothetical protein